MSDLIQFKVQKNERFVIMELTVLETQTLSFKAKGIHAWFMARPPNWKVNFDHLITESTEGRAAIRSGIKELEAHGFLTREKTRVVGGLFSTLYTVRETPIGPAGNTHNHPPPITTDQGRLSNVVDQGRLSTGGSPTGGSQPPIVSNRRNKHLEYATPVVGGSEDPQRAVAPPGCNPHARQVAEKAEKDKASLVKASEVPETYQPIFDAWGRIATKHQPGTKVVAKAIAQIRRARTGSLFKGKIDFEDVCHSFTVQNIITAIERFGLQRNDPDYMPQDKTWPKKVDLAEFFYNIHSHGNKSWFAVSIRNGLQLAADFTPELTEFVTRKYTERKGGKLDFETAARIAAKLNRYWDNNEAKLREQGMDVQKRLIIRWFNFLKDDIPDWGPQHFLAPAMDAQFERYVRQ